VRAGRFDEALKHLVNAERDASMQPERVYLELFRALAEHGRRDVPAGRLTLLQATAWLDAPTKDDHTRTNFATLDWGLRVELEALRRECEQKLGASREPGAMNPVEPQR
jgi:hypothetical protein